MMIFKAIQFVAKAHEGHYRKGSQMPYITHLLDVMKILIENQCTESVIVAGILHDAVEDTPVTIEEITHEFGEGVAKIVAGASENDKLQKIEKTGSWEDRKNHTIHYLRSEASLEILLVVCADKLDNIRSIHHDLSRIGEELWNRFNAGKEKQQWYYTQLADIFSTKATELGEPLQTMSHEFSETVKDVFGRV